MIRVTQPNTMSDFAYRLQQRIIMYDMIQSNAELYCAFTTVSIYEYGVIWFAHNVTAILLQIFTMSISDHKQYIYNNTI